MTEDKRNFQPRTVDLNPKLIEPSTPVPQELGQYGAWDVLKHSFQREVNLTGRFAAQKITELSQPIDPDFNPIQAIKGTKYEQYREDFLYVPNQAAFEKKKQLIDEQETQFKLQAAGGFSSFIGAMAGSVIDPTTFLIPMAFLRTGKFAADVAKRSVLGGAQVGGIVAATEVAGHEIDVTRTEEESIAAVAASALIGGMMMGITTKTDFNVKTSKEYTQELKKFYTGAYDEPIALDEVAKRIDEYSQDAGKRLNLAKKGTDIFDINETNAGFAGILKATKGFIPSTRVLTSQSKVAKLTGLEMFDSNFAIKGEKVGVASPVSMESVVRTSIDNKMYKIQVGAGEIHANYKQQGGKLSLYQFKEEAAKAMRRGEHPDPHVESYRKVLAADLRKYPDLLEEAGVWSKEVADKVRAKGDRYFPRMMNVSMAESRLKDFTQAIENAVKAEAPDASAKEISEAARDIVSDLMDPTKPMFSKQSHTPKSLKGRSLIIDDSYIDEFLINDPDLILGRYYQQVDSALELTKRFGDIDMKPRLKEIVDDYDAKIKEAPDNATAEKLQAEKRSVIEDLEFMRDKQLGLIDRGMGTASRTAINTMLAFNYVHLMGSAAITQLADYGRMVGVVRMAENTHIKDWTKSFMSEVKKIKFSKKDAQKIGVSMEMYNAKRAMAIADMDDLDIRSKWDRWSNQAIQKFNIANLMSPMNDFNRWFASKEIANNMIDDMAAWQKGKLSMARQNELLKAGVSKARANKILKLIEKHGETIDGELELNVHKWGYEGVEFQGMIRQQADTVILMPGLSDRPIWMSQGVGRLIGQFRGFTAAAWNKAFLPNLQDLAGRGGERAAASAMRMMTGVILGGAAGYLKETIKGRDPDWSVEKFLLEGFDRGGAFPVLADVNNILDRFGAGAASLTGVQKASRFRDASTTGIILGVTAGTVDQLVPSLARVGTGQATEQDYRQILRRAPGFNLLYWNWMTDTLFKNND